MTRYHPVVALTKNFYYKQSDFVCTALKQTRPGGRRQASVLQAVNFGHFFGPGATSPCVPAQFGCRFSLLDHQKSHFHLTVYHGSGVGRYSAASVTEVMFCDSGHVGACFQNGIHPVCFLKAWLPRWITEWCNGCLFSVTLWRALVGHSKWSLAYCCSPDTSLGN